MNSERQEQYDLLIKQVESFLEGESDIIANMANISALIKTTFDFWWVGYYIFKENQLVLGPFQGPVACTRIPIGKGVCGTSFAEKETLVVANVHEFEGHIACSAESNSEIVVPVIKNGKVFAVLDIDSKNFNDFSETDKNALEIINQKLADTWEN